jgi:hypothetical protein
VVVLVPVSVLVVVLRSSLVEGLFDWALSPSCKTSKEIDDEDDDDHDDDEEEDEHDDEVDAVPPWGFMGVASQGRITRKALVRAEPHPTDTPYALFLL